MQTSKSRVCPRKQFYEYVNIFLCFSYRARSWRPCLRYTTILYDLIYNPDETLFLTKGAKYGATTKNGLEMLLLQAFASWEFWNDTDNM